MLSINVVNSTSVTYPTDDKVLKFQTDYQFTLGSEYYILLDTGKYTLTLCSMKSDKCMY